MPAEVLVQYDLTKPATASGFGAALYYLRPVLTLVFISLMLWFPPMMEWRENYFLFVVLFVPFIMPLYGKRGSFFARMWPQLLGMALLLFGLLIA